MDLVHLGGSVCLVSASMLFIYFVGSMYIFLEFKANQFQKTKNRDKVTMKSSIRATKMLLLEDGRMPLMLL